MKKRLWAAVFGLAACVGGANAANVRIDTTYDLGGLGVRNQMPLDDGPVTIASGDHVILNVTFRDGLALTIGDGGEDFRAFVVGRDNDSSFTINNARIMFDGFSSTGGAQANYVLGDSSDGAAHIGPTMWDFLTPSQSITFSGYTATFNVESIAVSPHVYYDLLFVTFAQNTSIGPARRVPEPASMALIALGLAPLVWGARKRAQNKASIFGFGSPI